VSLGVSFTGERDHARVPEPARERLAGEGIVVGIAQPQKDQDVIQPELFEGEDQGVDLHVRIGRSQLQHQVLVADHDQVLDALGQGAHVDDEAADLARVVVGVAQGEGLAPAGAGGLVAELHDAQGVGHGADVAHLLEGHVRDDVAGVSLPEVRPAEYVGRSRERG
jgi:hypothetical protein